MLLHATGGLQLHSVNITHLISTQHPARHRFPVCQSLFNFAEVEVKEKGGGRRNRKQEKRDAQGLIKIVKGLTDMSPKQLQGVSHLLEDEMAEAIGIAAKIPGSNQGRKRQEGLVEKMLRTQLSKKELDKLEDAVKQSQGNNVYQDPEITELVEGWCQGIAARDQGVIQEVLAVQASFISATTAGERRSHSNLSRLASRSSSNDDDESGNEDSGDESGASTSGEGVMGDSTANRASVAVERIGEQRALVNLMGRYAKSAQDQQLRGQEDASNHEQQRAQGDTSISLVGSDGFSGRFEGEDEEGLQEVLAVASTMAKRGGSLKRAAVAVKSGKALGTGGGDSSTSNGDAAEKAQAQKRRRALRKLKAALKPLALHVLAS